VGTIRDLLGEAYAHLQAQRFEEAGAAYERVLTIDRLNQHAKKGLLLVSEGRSRLRASRLVPREKVPFLTMDFATLTTQDFDPLEGFVLLARQQPVGRAVDPQAVPDRRGGRPWRSSRACWSGV